MTRSVFAVAVVVSLTTSGAAQVPSFKTGVDAVQVDVAVTRGGRSVTGLAAADFNLRDSGVLQHIDAIALENVPLHLVLALDTSSSVRGEPLMRLKEAARAAAASLRPDDRVALLTFSHVIERRLGFSADTESLDHAIADIEAGGATALHDAASAALALRTGGEGRMLVLLFTDGFDTASWLNPLAVIEQARRSDVVVEAVRLPEMRDRAAPILPAQARRWFLEEPQLFRREFLQALADETGGDVIVATGHRDLTNVFQDIVSAFKSRYVLSYAPKGVLPSGWHPIEVRLTHARGDVRARRGYTR